MCAAYLSKKITCTSCAFRNCCVCQVSGLRISSIPTLSAL